MTNEFPKHDLLAADAWPWNYLLIDGASLPEAERLLYQACDYPEHMNLFAGPTYGEIADVGPLLVQITFEHPLVQRLIEADFTQEWGYLLRSALDLSALTHWFRRFITARHPSGVDFFCGLQILLRLLCCLVMPERFAERGLLLKTYCCQIRWSGAGSISGCRR